MPLSLVTTLSDLPESLAEDFAQGDGLLWTGAGVSRRQSVQLTDGSTIRAGVPAAGALEAHLRDWAPEPHPQGADFEALVTIYAQRLGRCRLNRLLRSAYSTGARVAPPFYDCIARLPPSVRVFVTTNYDPFLERALEPRHPAVVVVEQSLEAVSHRRPTVYKVHGDAASPDTCVITTPDYDRWERDATQLKDVLSTLFVQHTVVALGYRAQDGNFRRLLGAVNARVRARDGCARTLFVVTPDAALENFAAYDVPEHEVVLVRATGEEFLDWLVVRLHDRERAAEAEALSRLIDAPAVRAARDHALALRPTASPAGPESPDRSWVEYAEALLDVADGLQEARRADEAIRTRADASRAFRVACDDARADTAAREAYTAALTRRDARLADSLQQRLTWPVTGTQRVRAPTDADVVYLVGLADVLAGEPGAPPALLAKWNGGTGAPSLPATPSPLTVTSATDPMPAAGGTIGEVADPVSLLEPDAIGDGQICYRFARLSAEYAVTILNFDEAAKHFGEAADHAASTEERADCQVRAALFSGLSHGTSAAAARLQARATLQTLAVPEASEPLRQRAESWLAALDGELALATDGFIEAGRSALAGLEAVGAAGAYRCAEWAIRQRPDVLYVEDNPGTLAYRLESSVARYPAASRVSAHELLEEAERRLHAGKTREAWLAAVAAQRLAYDDIDPGNVHRTRLVLAEVWERTLAVGGDALGDAFSLHSAFYYSTLVHAELDDAQRDRRVEVLTRALTMCAGGTERGAIVAEIGIWASSRAERAGVLMLLSDLAPAFDTEDIDRIAVPLLREGIVDGWGRTTMTNSARAACRLLGAIQERLTPAAAAVIREDLARLESGTPGAFREDLYLALAQATDCAGSLPDGGATLARQLLDTLEMLRAMTDGRPRLFRGELGMALAAVMLRATPDVATLIRQELELEAAARYRQGAAVLAARGVPLPRALLDEYLREITDRMRALTRIADRAVFGVSPSDDIRLTQRAGADASLEVRHAAIDAVIALLGEDRQREVVRAAWVDCAVHLAWGSPERRTDIVAALVRLAAGAFVPSGVERPFSDHVLSIFRATGFDAGGLQANALHGLGALWTYVAAEEKVRIREALEAALVHPDPVVRKGVILGLRDAVTSAADWTAVAAPYTSGWQVEGLVRALADPLPEVQTAARRALVALARPASAQ